MLNKYYSILGLSVGADKQAIKQAYRRLVMVFHPDRGPSNRQRFIEINEAYDVLMGNKAILDDANSYSNLKTHAQANVVNMQGYDQCRREGRRGTPGQRRFECIQEQQYIGTRIKARA